MMLPAEDGGGACTSIELQLLKSHGMEMVKQRRAVSEFLRDLKKEHVPEHLVLAAWELWSAQIKGGRLVYAPPADGNVPSLNPKKFAEQIGGTTHTGFWISKLFECCDVNSDGDLPLLEFLRFLPKIVNVPKSDSAALVFFFNLVDSDKSGEITEMDLAALNAESKSTAQRDQRDQFGLAGVQSDKAHKAHRHRSAGPTTLLEYARTLPGKLAPRVCLLSLVF
jgi:Ca2+-binding EF-hand superfamily protein